MVIFLIISSLSFGFFTLREIIRQKDALKREASYTANFIADYCSAPLVFGIRQETQEVLQSLESNPAVLFAAVYNRKGELFDTFNLKDKTIPKTLEGYTMGRDTIVEIEKKYGKFYPPQSTLLALAPVEYQNEFHGTVIINYSLDQARLSIRKNQKAIALVLFFIAILVFLLAYLLQKIISEPILELAAITQKVISEETDFSIRVSKRYNNEIGILYEGFNKMMEQISLHDQKRDDTELQLKKAKDQAENADKLKSAFLANMSHEIRTPMNSIVGFAGLLGDASITSEERTEYVELINSSCNTLLHLIDDILDISKIEAGQLKISLESCNLNEILQEIFVTFKEINFANNNDRVELLLDIPPSLANLVIETDTFRFKQVLSNLLGNSIKFTHSGKICLGVTLTEKIKNQERKKYVKFYVADTGIGMDTLTQQIVFDRFAKLESDNDKLYRGAGLGLTISKKIIELLEGEIWLESNPGEGSTFYFTIPAPKDIHISDTLPKSFFFGKTGGEKTFEHKTILIVEDDPSNYELLKALLRKTRVQLAWSKNGIEALDYCIAHKPHLILMDIKMPDMDGFETFQRLREMNIRIPIIAQTAFARLEDEKNILESGFDGYLSKPIEKSKLIGVLKDFLTDDE